MLVTDRLGGIDGLRRRLRRPAGPRPGDASEAELVRPDGLEEFGAHEFADDWDDDYGEEAFDDLYHPAPRYRSAPVGQPSALSPEELETRVLEVFRNDPELSECAIDISADEDGVIELAGWVTNQGDIEHALTLARGVPDIGHVVSLLAVKPSRA